MRELVKIVRGVVAVNERAVGEIMREPVLDEMGMVCGVGLGHKI